MTAILRKASAAVSGSVAVTGTWDGVERSAWRGLFRLGAGAAVFVIAMIPLQPALFIVSPPPATAAEYFDLFQDRPLLGLLDLDLLLILDYLVMIPLYVALYAVIRPVAPAWALLALILGLFALVLYVVSREATFSMWMLSNDYAAATDAGDRAAIRAAGVTLLTLYNGGTFATSYLLGALSTLMFSAALLRHKIFGTLPGRLGLVTGLTMLIPPNVGQAGLVLSMLSLLPTAAWLALLSAHLFRLGRDTAAP